MKRKLISLLLIMGFVFADLNASGINLKAKKTKETKVDPIYIQKVEAAAEGKNGEEKNLEGLLFLFEITKLRKNDKHFYLQELRDFKIDGISYAQITKEKTDLVIEPHTEILESYKFIEKNPSAKNIVKNPQKGIIMQTVIYGAELPKSGNVTVTAQVGWADLNEEETEMINGKIEDFVFEFDLSALADEISPSEISEKEKNELLRLISNFKQDKDFSKKNLKNYSYIIEFASESDIVQITIDSSCFPEEIASSEYSALFLLAYVCGNLEKQLLSGDYNNAQKEGIEFEVLKYKQLKELDKDINISFLEDLM